MVIGTGGEFTEWSVTTRGVMTRDPRRNASIVVPPNARPGDRIETTNLSAEDAAYYSAQIIQVPLPDLQAWIKAGGGRVDSQVQDLSDLVPEGRFARSAAGLLGWTPSYQLEWTSESGVNIGNAYGMCPDCRGTTVMLAVRLSDGRLLAAVIFGKGDVIDEESAVGDATTEITVLDDALTQQRPVVIVVLDENASVSLDLVDTSGARRTWQLFGGTTAQNDPGGG